MSGQPEEPGQRLARSIEMEHVVLDFEVREAERDRDCQEYHDDWQRYEEKSVDFSKIPVNIKKLIITITTTIIVVTSRTDLGSEGVIIIITFAM